MEFAVAAPPVAPAATEPLQHCKVADNDGRQPGEAQSQVGKRGDVTSYCTPTTASSATPPIANACHTARRLNKGAWAERGGIRIPSAASGSSSNTSEQAGSVRATPRGSTAERPGRRTAAAVTGRRWVHALRTGNPWPFAGWRRYAVRNVPHRRATQNDHPATRGPPLACHVGAALTHRNADIRGTQGWAIVDAVSHHGGRGVVQAILITVVEARAEFPKRTPAHCLCSVNFVSAWCWANPTRRGALL